MERPFAVHVQYTIRRIVLAMIKKVLKSNDFVASLLML